MIDSKLIKLIIQDLTKFYKSPIVLNLTDHIFATSYRAGLLSDVDVQGGLVLEFGVFSGTSIQQIQSIYNKHVYGFDSWMGLPESDGYFKKGEFDCKGKQPEINNKNITLIDGWFEDTLPKFAEEHPGPVQFINFDADLYSSTKTIFNNLKDRFVRGTVMYFDEYKLYPDWEDREYRAFLEFIHETGFGYEYICRTENEERCAIILV